MSNIDKIKAEIERRKGYISVTHFAEELLSFIATLDEQPSEYLEKAAEKHASDYPFDNNEQAIAEYSFIAGANWQEKRMKDEEEKE